jgi:hypothetical protein
MGSMPARTTLLRPVRPRFELTIDFAPQVVLARLDRALADPACGLVGSILDRHVELLVEHKRRHFWSPWLSAEVRPKGAGVMITGRFGPHPNLWTFFVALYAMWSFGAIGALVFGYSQWTLGHPPNALWGVPFAALLALGQYVGSIVGQRLGRRQMGEIRRFVRQALDTAAQQEANEPCGSACAS